MEMDYHKAFEILNLSVDASEDEIKSSYKKLSKEYHPDINKAPNAHEKMVEINRAKDIALEFKQNPEKFTNPFGGFSSGFPFSGGGINIEDLFGFGRNHGQWQRNVQDVFLSKEISFKDSVLGKKIEIEFNRDVPCEMCEGDGSTKISNGCKECGGFGKKVTQNGGVYFQQLCGKCHAKGIKDQKCNGCNGNRFVSKLTKGKFQIPPGTTAQKINMSGKGHLAGKLNQNTFMFSNLVIDLIVKQEPEEKGLWIGEDGSVNGKLDISLLESLTGCEKQVYTIDGFKQIKIPSGSKEGEVVSLPKLGSARKLPHITHLSITLPKNNDKIPWKEIWDKYNIE